jgi:beta-glucosidase
VQIYVGYLSDGSGVQRPRKELCGFGKVEVEADDEGRVDIEVAPRSLSYWNDERKVWSIDEGKYALYIATSSTDIHAVKELDVPRAFDIPARLPAKGNP